MWKQILNFMINLLFYIFHNPLRFNDAANYAAEL